MDQVHSVQELLDRCNAAGMPLERMRFFINRDMKEPKCFGIYQDRLSGYWVVYKNKADGSRAVRYNGPDEGYAAQQIWEKIQSEIALRVGSSPAGRGARSLAEGQADYDEDNYQRLREAKKKKRIRTILIIVVIYFLLTFVIGIYFSNKPRRGYYRHNDDVLYYQNAWYIFNDLTGWARLTDSDYEDNWYRDAYYGSSYAFDDTADEFEYSPYYQAPSRSSSSSSSSSRDNDYDYDWDSWDSSDTDWDSDW